MSADNAAAVQGFSRGQQFRISQDLDGAGDERVRALNMITATITQDVARQITALIGRGWGDEEAISDVTRWWHELADDAICKGILPGLDGCPSEAA